MTYDYEGNINDDISLDRKMYSKAEVDAIISVALQLGKDKAREANYQQQMGDNPRTWSYYEELRKKDPYKYRDPKTQSQLFKDSMELGEAFTDGTFDKNLGRTC